MYYRFPVNLYRATGFVNVSTGEVLSLSPAMKLIYLHLFHRFMFFTKQLGGEMYESQAAIAKACAVDEKTVQRAVSAFVKSGVVTKKVTRAGGKSRTVYLSVSQLTLIEEKQEMMVDTYESPDMIDHIEYDEAFLATIQWEERNE